jgi:hypothetical protein
VTNKNALKSKILRIESAGGGIFVYTALSTAAGMLANATPATKHIILFADSSDSEEPGEYRKLLEACQAAGITCSVIGMGTSADCDAQFLRDVARRGNGQVYFTNSPTELPKLFAQDTFIVARSSFVDERTAVKATAGLLSLTGGLAGEVPDVGGYNLTYLRPEATVGMVTQDEYQAPLVASWQAGAGRVLCYTGQADGPYAGPMAAWERAGEFYSSMVRWTAGVDNPLPGGMLATQELSEGLLRVRLMLDSQSGDALPAALPTVNLLRGRPGSAATAASVKMQWVAPDELAVELPLEGDETAIASVALAGGPQVTLPPVCLPYSPEFRHRRAGWNQTTLADLSAATGGIERLELGDVWGDLPRWTRQVELRPWLLLVVGLLLGLEVLQRRTGLVAQAGSVLPSAIRRRLVAMLAAASAARSEARAEKGRRIKPKRGRKAQPLPSDLPPSMAEPQAPPPPKPAEPASGTDLVSAMRAAKRRSGRKG